MELGSPNREHPLPCMSTFNKTNMPRLKERQGSTGSSLEGKHETFLDKLIKLLVIKQLTSLKAQLSSLSELIF